MNSIHDMGGLTCFGPVEHDEDETVFHEPWERRVFGMAMLGMGQVATIDGFRHAIERMDPVHYLTSSYYEHWLAALETLSVERAVLTEDELAGGKANPSSSATERAPLPPEAIAAVVKTGAPANRDSGCMTMHRKPPSA